jgi:hypothetical protein
MPFFPAGYDHHAALQWEPRHEKSSFRERMSLVLDDGRLEFPCRTVTGEPAIWSLLVTDEE